MCSYISLAVTENIGLLQFLLLGFDNAFVITISTILVVAVNSWHEHLGVVVVGSDQDHLNLLQQVFVSPVFWICEEDILSDDALRSLEGHYLIAFNDFLCGHKFYFAVLLM